MSACDNCKYDYPECPSGEDDKWFCTPTSPENIVSCINFEKKDEKGCVVQGEQE